MKNFLKITLSLIILGFLVIPNAYAANSTLVDLNLASNTSSENNSINEIFNNTGLPIANVSKVIKSTTEENDLLTTDNIISILLSVIGVVLILLAIAILIRCK